MVLLIKLLLLLTTLVNLYQTETTISSSTLKAKKKLTLNKKSFDYNPVEVAAQNKNNVTIQLGLDEVKVKNLFDSELEEVLNSGPTSHLWNIFLDFLPERKSLKKQESTTKKVSVFKPNHRRIFTRQSQSNNDMVPNSELKIQATVQLALQSSSESRAIDAQSQLGLRVAARIARQLKTQNFDFSPAQLSNILAPNELCPFKTNQFCNATGRFQSFDGSCNNLQAPWLGKANTPYKRYHEPAYDDKLNAPRSRSVLGGELPNPRLISRAMFTDNFEFDSVITHITATFGQFLAHDITSAAVSSDNFGRIVDCPCNTDNPSCMSVNMPSNENIMRMSCMRFTRSSSAFASFDCRLGHREQLNLLTPLIDATQVYGPSEGRARDLRAFQSGQLRSSQSFNSRQNLPQAQDSSCRDTNDQVKCFAGGEGRVNENLALTSMHTLFLREHNRIASELSRINPRWDDERLFQETRKIIIGMMQHIVYNEWIPTIIGWNNAGLFDLIPLQGRQYYSGYDPNVNPSLSNEFASAAFRFGHTLVRGTLKRFNKDNRETSAPLNLFDIIFRPVEAYNSNAGGFDSLILGLITEPASKFDPNLADALQNRLFEVRLSDGSVIAADLAATNINRGRDHGVPSYNFMREKCGLRKATNFQDLVDTTRMDKVAALQSVYKHVDDIDLYPGGLAESPVNGGVIGPTFACIIANQFKDLKKGDRFYYENGPSPTAFTLDQLREIKKGTLSKMICNNIDVNTIQPSAFLQPLQSLNNGKISCSWLPSIDLTKWKE